MKKNKSILQLLLLIPFLTYASGGDVLILMWLELLLIVAFVVSLLLLKIRLIEKGVLILTLIFTELIIQTIIYDLPYSQNRLFINSISIITPILTVFASYLLIKLRYKKKN